MAFELHIIPDEQTAKMPTHTFLAILSENLAGEKSPTECRDAIESLLGVSLTANMIADITATINYIQAGSDLAQKLARMTEVYNACMAAEGGAFYTTQGLLRARLNWSTP